MVYAHHTKFILFFFFFQAEDGIRDYKVTGVQTCALPILFGDSAGPVEVVWSFGTGGMEHHPYWHISDTAFSDESVHAHEAAHGWFGDGRSEERRVGKECRSRWSPYH